jgi:von Willebrand factor type A domain
MPIDILLLLDVSASMRPHVQRISDAAHDALRVLADDDRVAIMVFDTNARVTMPFRNNRSDINRGLFDVLDRERFNGGTHITRAMLSAADYVQRNARPEARRAIVILTDDGSQDLRDDAGVERALSRADAILSFLQAPDLMDQRRGGMGGGYPRRTGSTWPGGGPIILGGGRGGGRYPGGGMGNRNHSAGTADIARDSGGDVFSVDDASALEETLSRLRQRYALHFNAADEHSMVFVDLTDAARRRYPDAEIHYRRVTLLGSTREAGAISITRAHPPESGTDLAGNGLAADRSAPANGMDDLVTPKRRRMAVDQSYGNTIHVGGEPDSKPPGPPE